MITFDDGNKVWHLRWTVAVCRDCQGLEYLDADGDSAKLNPGLIEQWFPALFTNPVLVCDLVWAAARRQHLDRTKEQLEERLEGEVADRAREALLDEVLNFIKSQGSRYRVLTQMRKTAAKALETSYAEIENQLTAIDSPLSAPENLESTPAN